MPIYEYECQHCGKQCEILQKVSDEPLKSCPDCGGDMHKMISPTSFILKGTGWYVTDHASPDRKKALEAEKKSDTVSEDKKESKPESTVEAAAKN